MGVLGESAQVSPAVSGSHLKSGERAQANKAIPIERGRRRSISRSNVPGSASPGVAGPGSPPGGPFHRVSWSNIVILGLLMTLGAPVIPGLRLVGLTDPFRIAVTAVLAVGLASLLASIVMTLRGAGRESFLFVRPPDSGPNVPPSEIECLAFRAACRLRSSYHAQIVIAIGMLALIAGIVVWSVFMVGTGRLEYGTALGSGGIAAAVLATKWQPFDRIGQARKSAERADVLATGLRLRLGSIAKIGDPSERQKAEWRATQDFMQEASGCRPLPDSGSPARAEISVADDRRDKAA
jgi:hypothetical protein